MKKLLVCLLAIILVVGMVSVTAAAATSSPQATGVVSAITATDKDSKEADFRLEKIDGKVLKEFQAALKDLKAEKKDDTLKVVDQYQAKVVGTPTYPITITLNVLGISSNSKVYVIVKEKAVANVSAKANQGEVITLSNIYNLKATPLAASNIKVFETTVENGKITFTIYNPIESLAIVTDGATATKVESENNTLSPQTFDNSVFVALVAMLSVLGLAVVSKKIKA